MDKSIQLSENNQYTNLDDVPIKAHINYDNKSYSLSTKTPVEALPKSNQEQTIASLAVPLDPNITNNFLAIKNTSSEDITLRLTTFNVSINDVKDVLFELEVKDEADVTGTFVDYMPLGISQYSTNPTFVNTPISDYPLVTTNIFGTIVKVETRLNLIKDDVILRWESGKVLCFSALCKNSNSFSFFIRHVEEY